MKTSGTSEDTNLLLQVYNEIINQGRRIDKLSLQLIELQTRLDILYLSSRSQGQHLGLVMQHCDERCNLMPLIIDPNKGGGNVAR